MFAGQNLAALSGAERAPCPQLQDRGSSFNPIDLLPELDALENVTLFVRIVRGPARVAEERGRDLLARVDLGGAPRASAGRMVRRRTAALSLARGADLNQLLLILADEPTGNLDSRTGGEIIHQYGSLREERKATLVIATHDDQVAARAPKRVGSGGRTHPPVRMEPLRPDPS